MILSMMIGLMVAGTPPLQEMCVALPKGVTPATAEGAAKPWYINNEPMVFDGKNYTKYGLPRVLQKGDVVLFTSFKGAALYIEPGGNASEVFYLLTNAAGCEFQPYVKEG